MNVYTVIAYRFGDRERHSYLVGIYSKKAAALKAAETEEWWRGGKYGCEVLEAELDRGFAGCAGDWFKPVKPLTINPHFATQKP